MSLCLQILRHLSEAGLTKKWVDDRMDAVAKVAGTSQRSEVNPLTVDHFQVMKMILAPTLVIAFPTDCCTNVDAPRSSNFFSQGAFIALVIGALLSTVVFVPEFVTTKQKARPINGDIVQRF